jgi:hypothetical protein
MTISHEHRVNWTRDLITRRCCADVRAPLPRRLSGHIKGKITVSFGKKLAAAEELAKSDEAGTQAGALSDPWLETCNVGMCSVM